MSKIYLEVHDKIYVDGNYISVGLSRTTEDSVQCNDSTIFAITRYSNGCAFNTGKIGLSNLSKEEVEDITDIFVGTVFKNDINPYQVYFEMVSGKYWYKLN